jgi:hypothetical protein
VCALAAWADLGREVTRCDRPQRLELRLSRLHELAHLRAARAARLLERLANAVLQQAAHVLPRRGPLGVLRKLALGTEQRAVQPQRLLHGAAAPRRGSRDVQRNHLQRVWLGGHQLPFCLRWQFQSIQGHARSVINFAKQGDLRRIVDISVK